MAVFNKTTSKRVNVKPMVFELDTVEKPFWYSPLVLMINPSSLEKRSTSRIQEQRTRSTGSNIPYIFHAHHDELDILTSSGRSAMFISNEKGLTRIDRTKTIGYENIEKLIAFYKNNGMNLNKKADSHINPCSIDSVGSVIIGYDEFIYKGHFISFSVTENEVSPFNIDYSFEYRITRTFDSNKSSGSWFV